MSGGAASWRPSASLDVLRLRSTALASARAFFTARNVMEVETPLIVSQPVSEPQLANVRCHLAVRADVAHYLHTSPEIHMKRLLAAGAPDIYQICKVFRDGELGPRHLPEFTMIEWYRRGVTFEAIITETCDLAAAIAGSLRYPAPAAKRYGYRELFLNAASLDPLEADAEEVIRQLRNRRPGLVTDALLRGLGNQREAWLDLVMVEVIEPALRPQGLVVVDQYPAPQAALARLSPADDRVAERFEVFLHGVELANGYHELADGEEQRRRFAADRERRASLGLPDVAPDDALLAALAAGLPDCCGVALGFDRLLMACLGLARIDQVVSFPVPEDG